MTLGINFYAKSNSPKTFSDAITIAQNSEMEARWIQVDAWNYAKDNPEYMDYFEQAWSDKKTRIENVTRYASTAKKFPHHRRKWQISIGFYYETATLDEWQQDMLLDRVVNEGLTRDELRAEAKKFKNEPVTETTKLEDLQIVTDMNGNRIVILNEIPSDVKTVTVKYVQVVYGKQESEKAA